MHTGAEDPQPAGALRSAVLASHLATEEGSRDGGKDDNPDTISGVALLLKGHNPSKALAGIHPAAAQFNNGLLPPDLRLVPYLDRTTLIEATLHTVG